MTSLEAVGVALLIVGGTIVVGLAMYVGWLINPLVAVAVVGVVCWKVGLFLMTPRPGDPDHA